MSRFRNKPPLGATLDAGSPLARSLVGYWLLNEGSGPTLRDVSLYRRNGAITAASWTAGTRGRRLNFVNGTSQFAIFGTSHLTTGPFSMFVRFTARTVAANQWVFDDHESVGNTSTGGIKIHSDNSLTFEWSDTSSNFPGAASTTLVAAGTTYDVLGTWDGTTRSIYVNGKLEGTNATAQTRTGITFGNLALGRAGDFASAVYFDGFIEAAGYWWRALTASEAMSLYHSPYSLIAAPWLERYYAAAAATIIRPRPIIIPFTEHYPLAFEE